MGCPKRIYNMDESGMPLDHKPPKVCRSKGHKISTLPYFWKQITVLVCANAAGSVVPPMVIFEGQHFNPEWSKGELPDTLCPRRVGRIKSCFITG